MRNSNSDISLIRKYLRGELSAQEMHMLEKRAQEDPMLMDMMIAMENGDEEMHAANLSAIDQLIKQRVAKTQMRKVIAWKTWMTVAASVILVSTISLWIFRSSKTDKSLRQQVLVVEDTATKRDTSRVLADATPKSLDSSQLITTAPTKKNPTVITPSMRAKRLSEKTMKAENMSLESRRRQDSETVVHADSLKLISSRRSAKQEIAGVNPTSKRTLVRNTASSIKGVVKDKETDEPLPGAHIMLAGKAMGVSTDSKGQFSIAGPFDSTKLAVSMIGYNRQQVNVRARDSVSIALEPNNASLSEVVVTGYDNAKVKQKLKPAIGWEAYHRYLQINNSINRGKVTVAFQVDTMGNPKSVHIITGLDEDANQQAIKLIYDGSRWIGEGQGSNEEMKVDVYFY